MPVPRGYIHAERAAAKRRWQAASTGTADFGTAGAVFGPRDHRVSRSGAELPWLGVAASARHRDARSRHGGTSLRRHARFVTTANAPRASARRTTAVRSRGDETDQRHWTARPIHGGRDRRRLGDCHFREQGASCASGAVAHYGMTWERAQAIEAQARGLGGGADAGPRRSGWPCLYWHAGMESQSRRGAPCNPERLGRMTD